MRLAECAIGAVWVCLVLDVDPLAGGQVNGPASGLVLAESVERLGALPAREPMLVGAASVAFDAAKRAERRRRAAEFTICAPLRPFQL
jgi:hypothetical protein